MKKLSLICAFLLVLSLTAFCGGKTEGPAAPGGKVTVKMMTIYLPEASDPDGVPRYAMVNKYLAAHPEVTLENNSIPHDDFVVKIKALIAANDLPDLWSARGDMVPPAMENGLITPVEAFLDMVPGWKDMFLPGAFDDFIYGGKAWAVPNQMQGNSFVFANMEILRQCGISKVPETLEELQAAIAKIKAQGFIPIGMGNKGKYPIGDTLMSAICDRYTGGAWFTNIREKRGASFTDPEFVRALGLLHDLGARGAFNTDINSLDEDLGRGLFLNGKAAMFFSGAWSSDWLEGNASKEILAATRVGFPPTVTGGKGKPNAISAGAGWGWQTSKKVTGAKLTHVVNLMYATTNYDYARNALKSGYIRFPSKTPDGADFSKIGPVTRQVLDLLGKSVAAADYFVLLPPAVLEVYGNVCQELAIGAVTPQEGAKNIQTAYERYVLNKQQ
jgi:raffinose/stachyose/melibiose transport system substrate-binding protein